MCSSFLLKNGRNAAVPEPVTTGQAMVKAEYVLSKEVTIINELGLHARAAAKIAALAQKAGSTIWILKGKEKVDASSILDILTLICPKGTKITLTAEKKSDYKILDEIAALVERGFGE